MGLKDGIEMRVGKPCHVANRRETLLIANEFAGGQLTKDIDNEG